MASLKAAKLAFIGATPKLLPDATWRRRGGEGKLRLRPHEIVKAAPDWKSMKRLCYREGEQTRNRKVWQPIDLDDHLGMLSTLIYAYLGAMPQ